MKIIYQGIFVIVKEEWREKHNKHVDEKSLFKLKVFFFILYLKNRFTSNEIWNARKFFWSRFIAHELSFRDKWIFSNQFHFANFSFNFSSYSLILFFFYSVLFLIHDDFNQLRRQMTMMKRLKIPNMLSHLFSLEDTTWQTWLTADWHFGNQQNKFNKIFPRFSLIHSSWSPRTIFIYFLYFFPFHFQIFQVQPLYSNDIEVSFELS